MPTHDDRPRTALSVHATTLKDLIAHSKKWLLTLVKKPCTSCTGLVPSVGEHARGGTRPENGRGGERTASLGAPLQFSRTRALAGRAPGVRRSRRRTRRGGAATRR